MWSLFVEAEDAKVLKRVHLKRAVAVRLAAAPTSCLGSLTRLQAVGALMWFDDHVNGAGSRAVLAGTSLSVASARSLVLANLMEVAVTTDSNNGDATIPAWVPESPPYQMPYGTSPFATFLSLDIASSAV